MAFLVLLESLAPAERAVFLLREVFGYDYGEIAGITGKTEAASGRPLPGPGAASTRDGRGSRRPAPRARSSPPCSWPRRTAATWPACSSGWLRNVVFYGDSGGKGESFISPVLGRDHVAQVIRFSFERTVQLGASLRAAWVNGQPGVLVRDADGDLIAVIVLDVLDGQVLAIRTVANPEKLRHLGPISRAWHQRWGAEEEES